jgi:IS5 family transposase
MRKITQVAGAVGTKLRDRNRSVKLRLLEIGRVARAKGPLNQNKLKQRYARLLDTTSRVVGQAKRFSEEISCEASEVSLGAVCAGRLAPRA